MRSTAIVAITLYDDDADGYSELAGDCDDANAFVSPYATEVVNGLDDNCDGRIDEGSGWYDDDGDGYAEEEGDCDDADADVHPGAVETDNDRDDDCDGLVDNGAVDLDSDGFTVADGDCDDLDGWVNPGQDEMCDWYDNDCDGIIDEGCPVETNDTVKTETTGTCSGVGAAGLGGWLWGAMVVFARRRVRVGRPDGP